MPEPLMLDIQAEGLPLVVWWNHIWVAQVEPGQHWLGPVTACSINGNNRLRITTWPLKQRILPATGQVSARLLAQHNPAPGHAPQVLFSWGQGWESGHWLQQPGLVLQGECQLRRQLPVWRFTSLCEEESHPDDLPLLMHWTAQFLKHVRLGEREALSRLFYPRIQELALLGDLSALDVQRQVLDEWCDLALQLDWTTLSNPQDWCFHRADQAPLYAILRASGLPLIQCKQSGVQRHWPLQVAVLNRQVFLIR